MQVQMSMFDTPTKPKPAPSSSVKSCSLIYTPKGRAREYARLACNVYKGCSHGCVYCFAPSATFKSQSEFDAASTRAGDFLRKLEREAAKYEAAGIADQFLLSFTCDPYQHLDVDEQVTRQVIKALHRHSQTICTLTKGGSRALRDLDLFGPGDAFATTLTLLDETQSLHWEPNAATPQDRIETIEAFHAAGVPTWVSLEPVIDPAASLEIIRQTHGFVDLFKVGKMNYHPIAKTIDWRSFAIEAVRLLKSLGYTRIENPDEAIEAGPDNKLFYVKRDLAAFLK